MHNVIWRGRSEAVIDAEFARFQSSIKFDRRLVKYDLTGSIAHVEMLAKQGILTQEEGHILADSLREIGREINDGLWSIPEDCEDIHSAIEMRLSSKIGALAGKLHTARSRNDQTATDFRLFIKDACLEHMTAISILRGCFLDAAEQHLTSRDGIPAVLPGYTHMQIAQPIHLSHWFLAYFEALGRDECRFQSAHRRMDECPLGAAALAGTSWPIDRHRTAKELRFTRPMRNSIDAVSSRDFLVDYLGACASLLTNLSRLAEDLILYSTKEFGFVAMPDAFATGSSIMPQKLNPDLCELTRAKAGRVFGNLTRILTVLKGLPMAYNRDLQEDKEAAFDTYDTIKPILSMWARLLPQLHWDLHAMFKSAGDGFSLATDLADALAKAGLPFREAHQTIGQLVRYCVEYRKDLKQLTATEWLRFHPVLSQTLGDLSVDKVIQGRQSFGSSGTALVAEAVRSARALHTVHSVIESQLCSSLIAAHSG